MHRHVFDYCLTLVYSVAITRGFGFAALEKIRKVFFSLAGLSHLQIANPALH